MEKSSLGNFIRSFIISYKLPKVRFHSMRFFAKKELERKINHGAAKVQEILRELK